MSQYNIGNVSGIYNYFGDYGIQIAAASMPPKDVIAAFNAFRQSLGPSPDTGTEEEFRSLTRELTAEEPSHKRILSRIGVVTAAAGTAGAIGKAAEALSAAVHAWLN
jgi:hypothetical protein